MLMRAMQSISVVGVKGLSTEIKVSFRVVLWMSSRKTQQFGVRG